MDRYALLLFFLLLLHLIDPSHSVFFHISDIHFDPIADPINYNSTTRCRDPNDFYSQHYDSHHFVLYPQTEYFYEIGGKYGRYGCDSPFSLVISTLQSMREVDSNPDFILMTGDSASHSLSLPQQNYSIIEVSSFFQKFFPSTSVYFTIGNNDVWPDYCVECYDPQYQLFLDAWSPWIPSDQNSTFLRMGAFAVNHTSTLRIISINTILYSSHQINITNPVPDPCGQFAWLTNQLASALESNQTVYIMGHILPGLDSAFFQPLWIPEYATTLIGLLVHYESIIAGLFFGHIHRDEFRVMGNTNTPILSASQLATNPLSFLVASSISPIYDNNPSYRLVYNNPQNYQVSDIQVYYIDLYTANLYESPIWAHEYTFTEVYGECPNSYSLMNIITALENSTALFDMWFDFHTSMYLTPKEIYICLISTPDLTTFQDCVVSKQYTKKKRWSPPFLSSEDEKIVN